MEKYYYKRNEIGVCIHPCPWIKTPSGDAIHIGSLSCHDCVNNIESDIKEGWIKCTAIEKSTKTP